MQLITTDEKSLILFFGIRLVDYGGTIPTIHMNKTDTDIAQNWDETGFVSFKRLPANYITETDTKYPCTHVVQFTENAWEEYIKEQRARAIRCTARLKKRLLELTSKHKVDHCMPLKEGD